MGRPSLNPHLSKEERKKISARNDYLKNRERIITRVKTYSAARKDYKSKYDKDRYSSNRETIRQKAISYSQSHKAMEVKRKLKEKRKAWAKQYPSRSMYDNMLRRCCNPNCKSYPNYGGKGVKVCDRWKGPDGYLNFCNDIGPRPEGMNDKGMYLYTVDRIDVTGNYEPSNIRWADANTQMKNTRRSIEVATQIPDNIKLFYGNEEMTLLEFSIRTNINLNVAKYRWVQYPFCTDWIFHTDYDNRYYKFNGVFYNLKEICIISGFTYSTIRGRLVTSDWSVEDAIKTPVGVYK